MFVPRFCRSVPCILFIVCCALFPSSLTIAQDETNDDKVIARYKQMLERKPKAGSTFDRLYQFYLEGAGLDAMAADYQTASLANPNNPNLQLILGHIYKRLGKDNEAVSAYQRAVELAPNNYYPHFALGQTYAALRQYEKAIAALTRSADYAIATKSATLDDLTALYKTLGRAYFSRDRVDEAILAWGQISELEPGNIFARIELADLFREQELYDQAVEQHEAIIHLKSDDPYRVCLSRREIGKIKEEKGDYTGAIQSYDAALALTGQGNWLRKDLQHRIIGIYAADGDWEGLIAYYQGKLDATPNAPELIGLLASAYIENQQLDDGIDSYRKALELAPTDAGLRLNLIAAFRTAERFEDAAAEYEILSEEQPDDFGIYRELGELYLQLEDKVRAKGAYQRMIDRDPENAGTHLILAEVYAGHDWLDDAIAAYEKAISLAPDNLDYIEYFGEFYFRQGSREKAVATWNRMVDGDRAIAANYDRLAQLLDAKDFQTDAISASRKAVELAPEEYRYREAFARRLMGNKDYEEALTEYVEASKLAPNEFFAEQMGDRRIEIFRQQGTLAGKIDELEAEPESFDQRKQLAKMYLKLGNLTNALETLIRAKELEPDDVQITRWLADIYVQQGLRHEAVAIFEHLVEIDSANSREHYAKIARSHLDAMDFDAATAAAKQTVAHSPRNPEGHQMLAEIAKQIGNYETSSDSLKQAIRLRPEDTDLREELAEIYKLSGNVRQAIEQYWRCWELGESVDDKLAFVKPLSDAYYDLGRADEFEDKLKQMSKANPSDIGPVLALAEFYQIEGDLLGARFQLAQALDRERDDSNLLAQLVEISRNLGDTQDALTYLQRLVKVEPDPFHQQRLGDLLFDLGREQEAIQAWTKLLHSRNQTLEAEIKLAALLIRHGLLDEALLALNRAGEKVKDAKAIYQVGAALVEMNELDLARPHFLRILEMPKPPKNVAQAIKASPPAPTYGPPGININRFSLAQRLVWQIQQQPYGGGSGTPWLPKSFEEAQAGAFVQLTTIAQQRGKLSELTQQFEAEAAANPKDINALERLAQLYTILQNTDKVAEVTERLIAASPNDLAYQAMRLTQLMQQNLDPDTFTQRLEEMVGLTSEARLWFTASYVGVLYNQGRQADAAEIVDNLETANVTDLNTVSALVTMLTQMGRIEAAERLLAQLQIPLTPAGSPTVTGMPSFAQQQWWRYVSIYQSLAAAYVREGHTDKSIELYWAFFDRTKPNSTNPRKVATLAYSSHSYGGYSPIQSNYPSPTIYYDQSRLQYLQQVFSQFWTRNQQEALTTTLQDKLEDAEGRDRIFPGLALSYCYWWGGKRDEAQEILSALQNDFPRDLTLKVNTVFVSIQTGLHATALELLDELAGLDPRNRRQYYDLSLQLAAHTGNTVKVRELMTKVLNSPVGVRELYQFSQTLQQAGLTQYAIAVAKKVVTLAMGQRDPNFLMELSSHLENLGRGQDATLIAERALRFASQRDRYGQTLHSWGFQQAAHLVSRSRTVREREPQLVEATEKNPDSFQAQVRLASYYEGTNQVKKASAAFDAALALRPRDSMTRQRYAQMLQRSGNAADAVVQYVALLKQNPNALGYNYWELMETFFQAGKVNELVSIVKDMIAPSVGRTYVNYFAQNVADRCIENNNAQAAVQIYEKIHEVLPDGHNTYANLASAYAAAGDREKAIEFLREKLDTESATISQNPQIQVGIVSKLTELYKSSGNIEILLAEYEAKLVEEPGDPSLLYLVASMKIAANDLEGSDPLVNQLLDDKVVSVNAQRLSGLADAYRGAGDRNRELRLLEAAAKKLDPQRFWQLSDIYRKLGAVYAQKGEKEQAKGAFRKMGMMRLMMYGGSGGYWEKQEIATLYMQHEMWDDAEATFTEIVNDLSADKWAREQAQQRLIEVKSRKGGLQTTTRLPEKLEEMAGTNLGMQRMLAQQYMQQNELSKAVEIYEQIAQVMPEDFESRAQLANIYTRQNKHDKAIGTWQGLLEADPENTKYQDGIVNSLREAGRFPEALDLAQKYIEGEADSGVHYIRLARVYAAENHIDDAIEYFNKAIEFGPGDGQAYRELAQLYLRKNDLDSAEKAFDDAIQYTGQEWERRDIERQLLDIYRRQGKLEEMLQKAEEEGTLTLEMQQERARRYQQDGKLEEAVDAFKKALDMTSQSWERNQLSNELVQIYVQLGEHDLAVELYEMLSRSGSSSMSLSHSSSGFKVNFAGDEARETLINAYRSQGKLEQLKTRFEKRLETEPENPAVVEMLAEIHRNTKDHNQAAELYQSLCKIQPGNVRSYYYAAAAFNKDDQPDIAKELLNQGEVALSGSNRNQDMWFLATVGSICLDGEMYTPAIKLVEDAIAAISWYSPWESERLYGMLGQCYLGAKRYEEAVNAYQQMANVAQDDSGRKTAEAAMRRAYRDGNLYEDLIAERTQAVVDNPDDPDTHFALAQTYEWNDMPDEAIASYELARGLNPDSAVILAPLAILYEGVDREKAIPLYKRLIELEESPLERVQRRRSLVDLYTRSGEHDAAITEMLSAVRSSEDEVERGALLPSMWNLYSTNGRRAEGIATLEALKAQLADSPAFHEILGDAYKEVADPEKAEAAYTQWVDLRQKELNRRGRGWGYFQLVSELLTKRVLPKKVLELAERALQLEPSPNSRTILGQAYLFNGQPGKVKELIQSESTSKVRHGLVMLLANHYERLGEIDADVESMLRTDALHAATPTEQEAALRGLWELYEAASRSSQVDVVVGKPAPSIKLNKLSGEEISISDFSGEVVLLNFWAAWCPPCVRGIPQFQALHEQYNAHGLVVLGISLDEKGEGDMQSFVAKYGVTYSNLIADQDAAAQFDGLDSLPATFLIDRNGTIVKHYAGYTDQSVFQKDIKTALAESRN